MKYIPAVAQNIKTNSRYARLLRNGITAETIAHRWLMSMASLVTARVETRHNINIEEVMWDIPGDELDENARMLGKSEFHTSNFEVPSKWIRDGSKLLGKGPMGLKDALVTYSEICSDCGNFAMLVDCQGMSFKDAAEKMMLDKAIGHTECKTCQEWKSLIGITGQDLKDLGEGKTSYRRKLADRKAEQKAGPGRFLTYKDLERWAERPKAPQVLAGTIILGSTLTQKLEKLAKTGDEDVQQMLDIIKRDHLTDDEAMTRFGMEYLTEGLDEKLSQVTAELTLPGVSLLTWTEIGEAYKRKYGDNHHHLKLICTKCGNVQTCRCSNPKITEYGVCYDCCKSTPESREAAERFHDREHDEASITAGAIVLANQDLKESVTPEILEIAIEMAKDRSGPGIFPCSNMDKFDHRSFTSYKNKLVFNYNDPSNSSRQIILPMEVV